MFSSLLSSSQGAKTTSSKEQLLALHTKEALRVKIPSKLEEEEGIYDVYDLGSDSIKSQSP